VEQGKTKLTDSEVLVCASIPTSYQNNTIFFRNFLVDSKAIATQGRILDRVTSEDKTDGHWADPEEK
jgi:hypothetical protein